MTADKGRSIGGISRRKLANEFVANFVGTSNVDPATVTGDIVDFGFAEVADAAVSAEGEMRLVIRPDDFVIGTGPIDAEIRNLFYLGEHVQAIVRLPDEPNS